MSDIGFEPSEVLPRQGMLEQENKNVFVLSKPKLMPLKSVTLERLEKMQKEAQDKIRDEQKAERDAFFGGMSTSSLSSEAFEKIRLERGDDYEALTRDYYSGQ